MLLERLALVTYHHVEEEVKLVLNGEKGVAKFISNLEIVGAAVEDAEKRQVKEAELRYRLDKLKVDLTPVRETNSILINMQFSEIQSLKSVQTAITRTQKPSLKYRNGTRWLHKSGNT